MEATSDLLDRFGDIACETFHYGAWDSGTRTIYQTRIPLWEETIRSGNPAFGYQSPPRFTAFPKELPATLPDGAKEMGFDEYSGPWIVFADELAAFIYCHG